MKSTTIGDILASLLGSFFVATWLSYKILGYYEVNLWVFGGCMIISFIASFYGIVFFRKKHTAVTPINLLPKLWDKLFPIYLLFWLVILVYWGIHLGNIFDDNFGKRLLDSIDNSFTRFWIDIYATGANGLPVPTEAGLVVVLFFTIISRFLGAIRLGAKQ
ncbi:hypothetical protein [Raineya orbicola]|uniref:Uncharacterized protein n=1 Tax=Raineya orbicola TaxID=2016530 RepID=A0A2N3IK10_9BACT|nr:hypothetical protein [Raineya orbicola]PKQ70646.1 hypothetical protein Rain11_0376 [Raineya orbicola]